MNALLYGRELALSARGPGSIPSQGNTQGV